jgi:hypothetical protein
MSRSFFLVTMTVGMAACAVGAETGGVDDNHNEALDGVEAAHAGGAAPGSGSGGPGVLVGASASSAATSASTASAGGGSATASAASATAASSSASSAGSGGSGGWDLTSCTGPAKTVGTVSNVTPVVTLGHVQPDPSGNLKVILLPSLITTTGDVAVGVYFFPSKGQLDYPPNGLVGCAVFVDQGSSFGVVDATQLCEVHLTTLAFASAPGVCDGAISGTFNGLFSGNAPLAGSFSLPVSVAESQTKAPGCQPPNGPCSQHSDCCSSSCSIFIGVCN